MGLELVLSLPRCVLGVPSGLLVRGPPLLFLGHHPVLPLGLASPFAPPGLIFCRNLANVLHPLTRRLSCERRRGGVAMVEAQAKVVPNQSAKCAEA